MKTIRWIETQGRHLDEIHRSYDTGLCNRIFYWEALQLINKFNNYQFTIEMDEDYWPELNELIDLPNTLTTQNGFDNRDEEYKPISSSDIMSIPKNCTLILNENKYFSDFKFNDVSYIHSYVDNFLEGNRLLMDITLKDKELESLIKEFSKDKIGIHVRRGRGIIFGENEINGLPEDIRNLYVEHRKLEGEYTFKFYTYPFISDKIYFKIIDKILKINPNQKFYISHDLPDNLMFYYELKYKNIVFTKRYFYEFIKNRYKTQNNHVNNVIDLFCLSNTKFLLRQPISTWSVFAQHYTKKQAQSVTDDVTHILDNIKKIL